MSPLVETMTGAAVSVESEVTRLRGGDIEAAASLMERYQHRLYRYLLRMTGQPATAEDLFQQTWLRVMERARSYDPRRPFEGWLFGVAHNAAIDYLRRLRPDSLDEPLPSGEAPAELLPGSGVDALEQLLAQETAEWVAEAMADLPAGFREVLTLRFEEEMKLEEIAEVLIMPLGTVKTRLHRALKGLRRSLEAKSGTGTAP